MTVPRRRSMAVTTVALRGERDLRLQLRTEPRNGEAGFLDPGTPFFAVEDVPPASGIGA